MLLFGNFILGLAPVTTQAAYDNLCIRLEPEYLKCNLSPAQLYQLKEFKRCQRKNSDDSRKAYCQGTSTQQLLNVTTAGPSTFVGSIMFGKFGSEDADRLIRKIVMKEFLDKYKRDFINQLAQRLRHEQVQKYPAVKDPTTWKKAALNEIESLQKQIQDLENKGVPITRELRTEQNRKLFGLKEAKHSLEFAIESVDKLLAQNLSPRVPQVIFTRDGGFDMTNASLSDLPGFDQALLRKQAQDYLEDYVFHAVQTGQLDPDELLQKFIEPTERENFQKWKALEQDKELSKYTEVYRRYDEELKKLYSQKRLYTVQEERKIFAKRADEIERLFPDFSDSEELFSKYAHYVRLKSKFQVNPPPLTTQGKIIQLVHEELGLFAGKNPALHHGVILKFKIKLQNPSSLSAEVHTFKAGAKGVKMLSVGAIGAALTVGSWMEQNRQLQWACDQEFPGVFTQYRGSSVFNPVNCEMISLDESSRSERHLIKILEEPYRWKDLFQGGEACLQLSRLYDRTFCD